MTRTLNLGVLAHVDAGKTSLTERLLHAAGVIDEIGRVDHGTTQTDTLDLERQRGITIRSAVVSFVVGDVTVNLIDTPGHPDFIAEVERALGILDGAVLVVSAVEGVQPQTRVLMRTLRRLRLPTLVFVNKIDRSGADPDGVLAGMRDELTPAVVALGRAHDVGTRAARFAPCTLYEGACAAALAEVLTAADDRLLADYLADASAISHRRLRSCLVAQSRAAVVHPVLSGSAVTGAGVDALLAELTVLLPATEGDVDSPVSGTVFKVERAPGGGTVAYVRMDAGTLRVRERIAVRGDAARKVTALRVFEAGTTVVRPQVVAGRIAKVWGLGDIRIGDTVGVPPAHRARHRFPRPALETVVAPCDPGDRGRLHVALTRLAEQDPLIQLRQDEIRRETSVSLYGEVQKEVIRDMLAHDFGVAVEFRATTTVCIERPTGTGSAVEPMPTGRSTGQPFLASVGFRVEPAPLGAGTELRLGIERGALPRALLTAVEETVPEALRQGLHGWEVTDCAVTLTQSHYWPRQSHSHATFDKSMSSTAGDFRSLTPLVLLLALRRAGTVVCEPVDRFRLEVPTLSLGAVLPALARLDARPEATVSAGPRSTIEGGIPAARAHELQVRLLGLTGGEGILELSPGPYLPVRGAVPTRPRTDGNPLDRAAYLRHLAGGGGG